MQIKDKRVMFFSVSFFGYEKKMKSKLEDLGAIVDIFNERSIESKFDRAIFKVFPNIYKLRTYRYYKKIINSKKNEKYDFIFIYGPDMIFESIMKMFVKSFPSTKLYMYNADSVIGSRRIEKIIPYFDKAITYDRGDYNYYKEKFDNVVFRPLFFSDDYDIRKCKKKNNDYLYDIAFIGTAHSDRQRIINEIKTIVTKREYSFFNYSYLQSKFIYWFYKLTQLSFRNVEMAEFHYEKINSSEITDILINTKVVLDMQHPKNSGLTMRTIEVLGMQKKIITTNRDIKNYDFYNPQNITVISRKDIKIDEDFLNSNYVETPENILNKYTLKNWIIDIFT